MANMSQLIEEALTQNQKNAAKLAGASAGVLGAGAGAGAFVDKMRDNAAAVDAAKKTLADEQSKGFFTRSDERIADAQRALNSAEDNTGIIGTAKQIADNAKESIASVGKKVADTGKGAAESVQSAVTNHPGLAAGAALGAGALGAGLAAKKYLASKKK